MKLKKIASLALAGIMAVSMLAGCKGTGSSSSDSTVVTPVDNSIAAYINSELTAKEKAVITFTYDSEVEAAAQKVAGALKASSVNTDTWINNEVMTSFREAMGTKIGIGNKFVDVAPDKDATAASLLVVNGTYTEAAMKDVVVDKVNDYINSTYMPAKNSNYKYDYAGKIGVAKITSTDGTYSAYVIGVVVDRTVTEQAN